MPIYETVFIARQDLGEAQVKELAGTCEKIIKDGGGKVIKAENWGLRKLAYRIKKNRKGHYVLIESDVPAPTLIEMERVMRLDENILRYISIKLDEPSKGPSPLLRKDEDRDSATATTAGGENSKKDKDDKEAA